MVPNTATVSDAPAFKRYSCIFLRNWSRRSRPWVGRPVFVEDMRQSDTKRRPWSPYAALALNYTALAYGGAWACWLLAILLSKASGGGSPSMILQVMGTLMPAFSVYVLFPQLRKLGLAPATPVSTGPDDPRSGFFRYAFAMRPSLRGFLAFAVLFVWRWVMFHTAFGFPATPADALGNAWTNLPILFLGGGFEEIGWRGCLQPALEAAVGNRLGSGPRARAAGALAAPLVTGVIWGLWHAPLCVLPGAFQNDVPLIAIVGVGVALSYSFGALSHIERGLDGCIVSHAWYNAMLVSTPVFGPVAWALFGLETIAGAVMLCFVTLYKKRSKHCTDRR